jgi:hypothetical protein
VSNNFRSGNTFRNAGDDWYGLTACVVDETVWRLRPEFVKIAEGLTKARAVDPRQPGTAMPLTCPNPGARQVALVPSDDYSKATLDFDRTDLDWAAITTPPVGAYRDRELGRWVPELCVAGDDCTGIRMKPPELWIYLPKQRAFVRFDEEPLHAFDATRFALRPGDGL